jgi:hypothetical protein
MAEYLRSIPPVTHLIKRPEKSSGDETQERDPWE